MGLADIQPINFPDRVITNMSPPDSDEIVRIGRVRRIGILTQAAIEGAVFGPFRQLVEIGGEARQAARDYNEISSLVSGKVDAETAENDPIVTPSSNFRDKLSFAALKTWYALPLPAYQLADDGLTYPVFLKVQEQAGTLTGYGVAAGAVFALAIGMGLGQRVAEKKKAELMQVDTIADDSELVPSILDASVNSAPWQVVRAGNKPRQDGDPIKIVDKGRVAVCAGSYAVFNSGLYAAGENLPGNEWVGFGVALAATWALQGAYTSVKERSTELSQEYQT